ncbi:hypothetical protein BCR39DRAFT_502990 [Naematelia encephala]|uniref:BZIP domain-containing protein n=1 Tax=Naematelia encephala TaxID=71784 RepID=A0A1Y2BLX5_9TREE|nr:hypothetical protein BCR39DRAFT_502990 [Naematelia encephala]
MGCYYIGVRGRKDITFPLFFTIDTRTLDSSNIGAVSLFRPSSFHRSFHRCCRPSFQVQSTLPSTLAMDHMEFPDFLNSELSYPSDTDWSPRSSDIGTLQDLSFTASNNDSNPSSTDSHSSFTATTDHPEHPELDTHLFRQSSCSDDDIAITSTNESDDETDDEWSSDGVPKPIKKQLSAPLSPTKTATPVPEVSSPTISLRSLSSSAAKFKPTIRPTISSSSRRSSRMRKKAIVQEPPSPASSPSTGKITDDTESDFTPCLSSAPPPPPSWSPVRKTAVKPKCSEKPKKTVPRKGPNRAAQNKKAQQKYRDKNKALAATRHAYIFRLIRASRESTIQCKSMIDQLRNEYLLDIEAIDPSEASKDKRRTE